MVVEIVGTVLYVVNTCKKFIKCRSLHVLTFRKMPKAKFIRDKEWQRQPHVKDGTPPSLWWYRRPDRHLVINAYIAQCKKGRTLPEGFKETLVQWLDDLSQLQNKKIWGKPRTHRYWDIPSYARANDVEPPALMKRLREMEKIAKKMFPDSVPSGRKQRAPLTAEEKDEIRRQYLEGVDAKELAQIFRIPPSHVGLICIKEKAIRAAQRAKSENGAPQSTPDTPQNPF